MTIIKTLELPFDDGTHTITLPTKKSRTKNRVTVIIGENGTRKSYLLRQTLEKAVYQINIENTLAPGIINSIFETTPSKVVAISSSPTDRFPSKPAPSDRLRLSRYDVSHYSYIGPRTAGNILSRNQSVDTVISALLSNPKVVAERSGFLKEIHSHLELNDHYAIGLDLSTMARRLSGTVSIYDYLKRRKKEAEDGKMLQKLDFISKMEEFAHSNKGREYADRLSLSLEQRKVRPKPKSSAAEFPFSIFVDTLNGGLDTSIGGSTDALRWAMEIGYLRPGRLTFKRKNGQEINQDELSAGQWSLFSVMTSLALSIQDDSLILIDEPESGLHPAWQRTFLDMFMKAISHAKRCHALIATHSPLLLSSLDPKTADLVSLTRDPATDLLVAELGALPLGWDTSLILQDMFDLEDARAPKLTKLVDKALGLIARGIQGNEQQLQTLITQIQPYYESLPEEDVGKGIISSIIKAVSAKK